MITPTRTSMLTSAPSHHHQPRAHRSARSVSLAAGLAFGLAISGLAASASAQTAPPPPPDPVLTAPPAHVTIYHESLGWTFEPIVTNGLIVGVFAHINDDLAFANNVDTVWIEAPSGEEWVVWGWRKGTSRLSAAMAIREAWNDETILQESPVLLAELEQLELNNLEGFDFTDPPAGPEVPGGMDEGAIGGTPAEQILAVLPDPITAQLLAQVGQDVAPGLSALMVSAVPSSDFPCEDGGELIPYEIPEGTGAGQTEQPVTEFDLYTGQVLSVISDVADSTVSNGMAFGLTNPNCPTPTCTSRTFTVQEGLSSSSCVPGTPEEIQIGEPGNRGGDSILCNFVCTYKYASFNITINPDCTRTVSGIIPGEMKEVELKVPLVLNCARVRPSDWVLK